MPLPLVLGIGITAATGLAGLVGTASAAMLNEDSKEIQGTAQEVADYSLTLLEQYRGTTLKYIKKLGRTKLSLASHEIREFAYIFSQLKEVDFSERQEIIEYLPIGLDEISLREMRNISANAVSVVRDGLTSVGASVLVGWGAYGSVSALATAATGTAVGYLNGIAATNATLAWLGGGTLAAGGMGVAGGTVVLGGLIAGPVLMATGSIANLAAERNFDNAYSNFLEAKRLYEKVCTAGKEMELIASSAIIINANLRHLGKRLRASNERLKEIVARCSDWNLLSTEEKQQIAMAVKYAQEVKAFIDMPMLTKEGLLTNAAKNVRNAYFKNAKTVYAGEGKKNKITMRDIRQWKSENVNASTEAMYIIDPVVNREITAQITLPDAPPEQYIIFAAVNKSNGEIACYAIVDREAVDFIDLEKISSKGGTRMENGTLILAGGLAAAALVAFILYKAKKGKAVSIDEVIDEKLVVTHLRGSDLTEWFRQKNPSGQHTNLIMRLTGDTISSLHLNQENQKSLEMILRGTGDCVIQAVSTKDGENILCCRAVLYETIEEKLNMLLKQNNNTVIVE